MNIQQLEVLSSNLCEKTEATDICREIAEYVSAHGISKQIEMVVRRVLVKLQDFFRFDKDLIQNEAVQSFLGSVVIKYFHALSVGSQLKTFICCMKII